MGQSGNTPWMYIDRALCQLLHCPLYLSPSPIPIKESRTNHEYIKTRLIHELFQTSEKKCSSTRPHSSRDILLSTLISYSLRHLSPHAHSMHCSLEFKDAAIHWTHKSPREVTANLHSEIWLTRLTCKCADWQTSVTSTLTGTAIAHCWQPILELRASHQYTTVTGSLHRALHS